MAAGTGIAYNIPMEAKLQIPDIPQAMGRGMDLEQKKIETEDVVQQHQDQQQDRQVLTDYTSQGGDLYTPEGIEKAKTDLRGKVSFNTYGQINKQADALKQHDIDMREKILGFNTAETKNFLDKNNAVLGVLVPVTESYQIDKTAKGGVDADANFRANRDAALQKLAQAKTSDGQPMFPPEQIQQFAQMDAPHLMAAVQVSKPYHDMAEAKWKTAQTEAQQALAEKNRKQAEMVGKLPDQDKLHIRELDGLYAQGLISKDLYERSKEGLLSKATAGAVGSNGLTDAGQRVLDKMVDRGVAPAGAFRGSNPSPLLVRTLNNLGAADADPTVGKAQFQADSASLRKIVPQYDAITAFEENTAQQGKVLKDLAHKVDQSGVPVVERWIRAGRRQIEGDADVSEFNAQIELYSAEAAKILTNPNLSGQLSDTARAEVKAFLPKDASAAQIDRVVDRLTTDFGLRKASLEKQIAAINSRLEKKTVVGGGPAPERGPGTKVTPGEQKDRDTDARKILEQEKADEQEKLASSTTPEARDRHTRSIAEIEKEISKLPGGAKPAASTAKKLVYDPATGTFK